MRFEWCALAFHFVMVFLHFSRFYFLSVCVFNGFNSQSSLYRAIQEEEKKKTNERMRVREIESMCELLQPLSAYDEKKKGRFCFETHQKM